MLKSHTFTKEPLLFFLALSLFANILPAQQKFLFMNGSEGEYNITDSTGTKIKVEYKIGENTKTTEFDKEDIFSITYPNNQEVVLYRQDSLSQENYLDVNDMRAYIAGEKDALKNYHSPFSTISSAAIGAGSGLFMPLLLAPAAPALWVGFMGSRWIKIKRKNVSDTKNLKEDMYVVGYGRAARSQRVQNALKGAGIGLATGLITSFFVLGNNKLLK